MARLRMLTCLFVMLALQGLAIQAEAAPADTPGNAVAKYVDNDTFLIGRLDVQQLPLNDLKARVFGFLERISNDPRISQNIEPAANQIVQLRQAFLDAGGQEVFLVVSMSDLPSQPPFFVVTGSDPQKSDSLETFLKQLTSQARDQLQLRKAGDRSFLVGSATTLDRAASLDTEPRAKVLAAWKAVAAAPIQLLFVPSEDQHRIITETFPQLPPPWEGVTGQALSDGIQWAVLTLEVAPQLKARLLVESKDAASANQLKTLVESSLNGLAQLPQIQQVAREADQLLALIKPQVEGTQVSLLFTEDAHTLEAVARPLLAAITAARQSASRQMSRNNLKQIALAMHNYHDKYKRFPPAASRDAAGKPLLSWRVHLLPYLEQAELYKQFKLDEPWDSENNKKLINIIPKPYLDPQANVKPGMTTYVVPIGEGTVFGGNEPLRLRDIRDGSSNTIMVVNALPDKAVIWTKPDDLPVVEATPLAGLTNDARKNFEAALCDGSVRVFTADIGAETLRLLLNANDGKPIDWNKVR